VALIAIARYEPVLRETIGRRDERGVNPFLTVEYVEGRVHQRDRLETEGEAVLELQVWQRKKGRAQPERVDLRCGVFLSVYKETDGGARSIMMSGEE
jgi:hypothetical protein